MRSNSQINFILYTDYFILYIYVKKLNDPPNPGRKKFAIERTLFRQTNDKCKHPQPAASRNLMGNPHRIPKALNRRGESYILHAESCSIQPLELDRLFVGNSRRFVETRLRVYQDLEFRRYKQREISTCDSRN